MDAALIIAPPRLDGFDTPALVIDLEVTQRGSGQLARGRRVIGRLRPRRII